VTPGPPREPFGTAGTTHVKADRSAPAGFFEVEAAGLRWLAEAEASGGARAVRVLDVRPGQITLERLTPAAATASAARDLGGRLAATHRSGAPWFGAPPAAWAGDGFIGTALMSHVPSPDHPDAESWGAFYAHRRVLPYLDASVAAGDLGGPDADAVREVAVRLAEGDPELCGPAEPAARLHGDLWAGNVVWTPSAAVLIDPAAHGGHRESDLAMLALFGLTHLRDLLAGYDAEWPLGRGWQRRVPVHQLHPLLVHTVLFGGGYAARAVAAARRCLAL